MQVYLQIHKLCQQYKISQKCVLNMVFLHSYIAGLYFCMCVDVEENNLMYLEAIHNFVEVKNF